MSVIHGPPQVVDTDVSPKIQPTRFSQNLAITTGLAILLTIIFGLYVRREHDVDRANDARLSSLLLAGDLRQSSGDLTRMARSYVSTGDSAYRRYYQAVLDIRDGKILRPTAYSSIDADLVPANGASNNFRSEPVALLELMRQAGFTATEFQKLAEAKTNSDALTRIEFEAMNLASTQGRGAAANHALAVRMLYDDRYNSAKKSIMGPIDYFLFAVDRRTQAAVDRAENMATLFLYQFITVGIALLLMLWTTYASLRKMMGGSVDDVYRQIAALGSGNFLPTRAVSEKHRDSVLGWVSGARTKLNEARLSLARDVTNRERADEALRQSEQRMRLVLDNALDAVITMGPSGAISDWNAQAEKMFGWTRAEALGQQMSATIIPERYRQHHDRGLKKFLESGVGPVLNKRIEITALRRNGSEFPVELAISPAKVGDDWTFSAFIRDLTGRVEGERALQASERRLVQILEGVPLGILVSDETGQIVFANAGGHRTLGGVVPGVGIEALARVYQIYVAGTDQFYPTERNPLVRALAGEVSAVDDMELHQGDEVVSLSVKGAPILDTEGRVVSAVVAFIDTTERKSLESQVRQASKMEAVGQLAGGVAHDFNNLLTVIMSYSAMLLDRLAPDDGNREDVQEIAAASDRAAALTRQLLAFSRKQVMQPQLMDINAVIMEVENMLRRIIGEDIELQTSLDPSVATINADPGQLQQVLMNLVVNARDAMPAGGRLQISTSNSRLSVESGEGALRAVDGEYVMLTVSDTGTGMTTEVQRRLFDPFFTTKDQGRGTGLGLSTVYGIVKQSSGEIFVHSELGEGSSFNVYFPRFTATSEYRVPVVKALEVPRGTETVLLVEDDANVRSLATRVLTGYGYKVLVASGGVEALEIASDPSTVIDLVLTDVVMPGINGRELLERIVASRPGIASLLMSGYTDDEVLRRGVMHGEAVFLQKPFTPEQLARKVRQALDLAVMPTAA